MKTPVLPFIIKQFVYYKHLGDRCFEQLSHSDLFWQVNPSSNSIAMIVKHLSGNMLSRWTDIFTTDGEKSWRERDAEFNNDIQNAEQLKDLWNSGWHKLFETLESLSEKDLNKFIYIRNQKHTVLQAIERQLAHYPYHLGQIVYIGKMIQQDNWQALSIAKNQSKTYNADKFNTASNSDHFTDDLMKL